MSDTTTNRNAAEQNTPEPPARAKKPYQRPSFQHERVFETMALICGKIAGTQGQCQSNPKLS
jgi:hypothetical protein